MAGQRQALPVEGSGQRVRPRQGTVVAGAGGGDLRRCPATRHVRGAGGGVQEAEGVHGAIDEVALLLEREAVSGGGRVAGGVSEGLALALALRVEGQHEVPGLGQRPRRPPVHVLGALDGAGCDDDGRLGARLPVRPQSAHQLGAGTGEEGHRGRRQLPVSGRVTHRTAGEHLPEGGVDTTLGDVGHLASEVREERLGRRRRQGEGIGRVGQVVDLAPGGRGPADVVEVVEQVGRVAVVGGSGGRHDARYGGEDEDDEGERAEADHPGWIRRRMPPLLRVRFGHGAERRHRHRIRAAGLRQDAGRRRPAG